MNSIEDISTRCPRCLRPISNCFCKDIVSQESGIKFVFLMHPKEARRQRTGTGRLASIALSNSEIIIGINFSQNEHLNSLLNDSRYYPVVMYPDKDAWSASRSDFKMTVGNKELLIILVDATWFCAKKIIDASRNLWKLPKLSFTNEYRSQFLFKKQPRPECLSTIETCYYIINELKNVGLAKNECQTEVLMDVFHKMVNFQIEKQKFRMEHHLSGHAYDRPFE